MPAPRTLPRTPHAMPAPDMGQTGSSDLKLALLSPVPSASWGSFLLLSLLFCRVFARRGGWRRGGRGRGRGRAGG
eukprot:2944787-Rhodomonas_salina.1